MSHSLKKFLNVGTILAFLVTVPVTLIFILFRGATSIAEAWQAFASLCMAISANFFNYYLTHTNLGFLTILILFSLGSLAGILFLLGQVRKSSVIHKEFKKKSISNEQLNKKKRQLYIIKDERLFALTVGFFKPTVYISSSLKNKLSGDELKAVIAHERFHQEHYHPLALLFINTLQKTLFFLPFLKDVVKYINLKFEISADEAAIFVTSRGQLASALVRVTESRNSLGYFIASTPGFYSASERIDFISGNKKPLLKLSWRLVVLSIGALFLINVFLVNSLTIDAHAQGVSSDSALMSSQVISDCLGENAGVTWLPTSKNQTDLNMTIGELE